MYLPVLGHVTTPFQLGRGCTLRACACVTEAEAQLWSRTLESGSLLRYFSSSVLQRSNPLGGLMYSNAYSTIGGNNSSYSRSPTGQSKYFQILSHSRSFLLTVIAASGGGAFCMTICTPSASSSDQSAYC